MTRTQPAVASHLSVSNHNLAVPASKNRQPDKMKTNEAKTPAQIGLSINVLSGPRGEVRDNDWPCISYTVELMDSRRRVIWTGPYSLGVGHVKPDPACLRPDGRGAAAFSLVSLWKVKPSAKFINKQLWAEAAALLAKAQKVFPKLEGVCYSLLMDGSAFFDGMRFENWAVDVGYSSDSIKAKETFETCDRIGRDLARALSRDELECLREWASNY